jgi:DNA-binding transcriptional regulator LsrR (DeoR family)
VRELIAQYKAGVTQPTLAREFGISRDTVHEILKRRHVQRRLTGMSDEGVAEAVELYAKGWSAARIGARLGVDPKSVWRALRHAGVQTRPRRGR